MAETQKIPDNSIAAFASKSGDAHRRYIVFGLEPTHVATSGSQRGAARSFSYITSHELFHVLGLQHPRSDAASNEALNSRSLEQLRQDIAPGLSRTNAFGSYDESTGGRKITYCFTADPSLVPHGVAESNASFRGDPSGIYVENMTHVGDCEDAKRNATHKAIRSMMQENFAVHASLFNVRFEETSDAKNANLLIYSADIPRRETPSFELTRGRRNAYNHDASIMSYAQAVAGIYPSSAVGDVYAAQQIYGEPPKREGSHIVTADRLTQQSGVLWSHEPLAIKLNKSPMLGALKIDMGAKTFTPAITGILSDEKGELHVRQHVAAGSRLAEIDADGASVKLDVTGASTARIQLGKDAVVRLKGHGSHVTLGPGKDEIIHQQGYGHEILRLREEDSIAASEAKKVRAEAWGNDTHLSLRSENGSVGSLIVRNATPETVLARVRDMVVMSADTDKPIELNARDGDAFLKTLKSPTSVSYREVEDVAVTALQASGHAVANTGAGRLILKMSRLHYDTRTVSWNEAGGHYVLTFRDAAKTHTIHLNADTAIAVERPDGKTDRLVDIAESMRELKLAAALRRSIQDESSVQTSAALPLVRKPGHELA